MQSIRFVYYSYEIIISSYNNQIKTYIFTPLNFITLFFMKARQHFLLLFTSLSSFAQQYTAIPDANFEKKLIALGIDDVEDKQVLTSKIKTITRLNVSNSSIIDLTGIQDFSYLTSLECGGNQLTNLDVSQNVSLESLYCVGNQMTKLDITKNRRLITLYFGDNQITNIDTSQNIYLEDLRFGNTLINNLDLSKNSSLKFLNCSSNKLTNIIFQSNNALTNLLCAYNQLTSLDVNSSSLTNLFCGFNELTSLNISKCVALKELKCLKNNLTNIDVSQNVALDYLDCGLNELTSLDVSKNINLIELKCYYNQLTSLDVSKNTALKNISCSSNKLNNLDVSNNIGLSDLFCHYNQLSSLDVSQNIYLDFLHCENNQLKNLDVSKNTFLEYLNCNTNKLTALNLKNGNNYNFIRSQDDYFNVNFKNNPNLTCIQVDDENYSNANWVSIKDDTAVYSTNCSILGTESHDFNEIAIYPIPTNGVLHIDNLSIEEANIYNTLGNLVKKVTFSGNPKNTLDLSTISSGVYHMNLKTKDGVVVKKIVIE
jgi:Leucine-rich repeat (LRR) protein